MYQPGPYQQSGCRSCLGISRQANLPDTSATAVGQVQAEYDVRWVRVCKLGVTECIYKFT